MRLAIALVMVGGCHGDPAVSGPDSYRDDPTVDGTLDTMPPACLAEATYPMDLDHGAFTQAAGHPDAIVYVPPGFDPTPPTDVVVYIHGFSNCITNILGETDTPCTTGGAARSAFQLATQLVASQRNALLVLPEVKYDQATGDPGALGTQDGMKLLLDEALGTLPFPVTLGKLVVSSHSGGYWAVSAMATIGGLPVDELWLFDSLYGYEARFDAFVTGKLAAPTAGWRFADFYSTGGGTLDNSEAMADRAAGWVAADPSILVDDRTTTTWPDETYRHPLLFKHSGLTHDGVARYYFEHALATSGLRATGSCVDQ